MYYYIDYTMPIFFNIPIFIILNLQLIYEVIRQLINYCIYKSLTADALYTSDYKLHLPPYFNHIIFTFLQRIKESKI
jgi:hypothetical protein